jgi:AdoMet-dependent heme synthase
VNDASACTAEEALQQLATAAGRGPAFLHLLVADRCNLRCQHCYQVQGLKGEMSFDEISALLASFRDAGGFVVSVSGGEATLRGDLIEILARARALGLATVLFTNAYLIDESLATRIARAGVWRIELSVYSDIAAEHDAVTRVPGSWARTVSGIGHLRKAGVNVRIKYTATRESTATVDRLAALAGRLDCALMCADHVIAAETGGIGPACARQDPGLVAERQPNEKRDGSLDTGPCSIGNNLTVRSDGVFQPCTNVAVELGRFDSNPDLAAAHGSEAWAFFRSLTWAHIHGCRDCDLRPVCSRCFGSAAVEAGDMLAPYRGACELAVARHVREAPGAQILPPTMDCGSARDPTVGPYRVEAGNLRPMPDVIRKEDERRALRFAWIRCAAKGSVDPTRC